MAVKSVKEALSNYKLYCIDYEKSYVDSYYCCVGVVVVGKNNCGIKIIKDINSISALKANALCYTNNKLFKDCLSEEDYRLFSLLGHSLGVWLKNRRTPYSKTKRDVSKAAFWADTTKIVGSKFQFTAMGQLNWYSYASNKIEPVSAAKIKWTKVNEFKVSLDAVLQKEFNANIGPI